MDSLSCGCYCLSADNDWLNQEYFIYYLSIFIIVIIIIIYDVWKMYPCHFESILLSVWFNYDYFMKFIMVII